MSNRDTQECEQGRIKQCQKNSPKDDECINTHCTKSIIDGGEARTCFRRAVVTIIGLRE